MFSCMMSLQLGSDQIGALSGRLSSSLQRVLQTFWMDILREKWSAPAAHLDLSHSENIDRGTVIILRAASSNPVEIESYPAFQSTPGL